jgi:two-component system response regulator RegX3
VSTTRTILLVEDEESITEPLTAALGREGWATHVTASAKAAPGLVDSVAPDLVLLDVMLEDGSGFDVCREIRQKSRVPIIMLTARGEELDRVIGLELGADDYVVKPFSARELIARIRAVMRRTDETTAPHAERDDKVTIGQIALDTSMRRVLLAGAEIDLTRKEYELLALLMANAGTVLTRERLIDEVWDTNWFGSTKTLDVHISGLRKKLGDDAGTPRYVHTLRGVGFRFSAPDEVQ